jgi:hypothetical protein
MQDLAADFIINNTPPIEFEAEVNPSEHFDCSFEINASPTKVSQLENDLNFQTGEQVAASIEAESAIINARIDDEVETLNTEINKKVETIMGSDFIDIARDGSTVIINSKTFVFEQAIAADTWVINYDLTKKKPTVDVIDSSGSVQVPNEIEYTTNTITLYFLAAFSGKAYLN